MKKKILMIVANDLNKQLQFIEESIQDRDFKPFHTSIWDAVILGGKQTLLPFETFENLQDAYSWMTYYNNELNLNGAGNEKLLVELLEDVKKFHQAIFGTTQERTLGSYLDVSETKYFVISAISIPFCFYK